MRGTENEGEVTMTHGDGGPALTQAAGLRTNMHLKYGSYLIRVAHFVVILGFLSPAPVLEWRKNSPMSQLRPLKPSWHSHWYSFGSVLVQVPPFLQGWWLPQ